MERNDTQRRELRLADQIAGEAADWFARLQDPNAPTTERDEFAKWLLRSPTHIEEYLAVTQIWGDAEVMTGLSTDDLVRQAREWKDSDNIVALSTSTPSPSPRSRGEGRGEGRWLRALAATLVIAALGWFAANQWLHPSHIETAIGEQRSVTLADGSVVHLNTDSEARITLSDAERRITLSRGEARFTVAKDATRPFFVLTPQATVRAVGTVFNVHATAERTAVTVIEGRVAVTQSSAPHAPAREERPGVPRPAAARLAPLELAAGQQAEVTSMGEILPDVGPSVERVLAWAERRLVFRDDSLADVVAEFNRYHDRPIRIADPALAALRLSGTFDASDPQSLIQYLEQYEHVRITQDSDGTKFLTR